MQFECRRSLPNAARIQTERSRWPRMNLDIIQNTGESQILEYYAEFLLRLNPPLVWLWFEIPPECGANFESS